MRQGIPDRQGARAPRGWSRVGAALVLLGAWGAWAAGGSSALMAEASAGGTQRTWTVLGELELRRDRTFLNVGYTGVRTTEDDALSHQLSAGVDHALTEHWLLSGLLTGGLPKASTTVLAPARPALGLPALDTRNSYSSVGVQLAASYDSAGFSDAEYGLDLGLGLTGYGLRREMLARDKDSAAHTLSQAKDQLLLARPSLGGRLLLHDVWELGLRGDYYVYSEDPLSVGHFTPDEFEQVLRRYADSSEASSAVLSSIRRRLKAMAADLTGRLQGLNALTGFPSAPVSFDLKPSVSYRFGSRVRGQLSYAFSEYVSGQGYVHVLGTRWTWRPLKPLRVWAALALQSDHPQDEPVQRSVLVTLGSEYTF